MSSSNPYPFDGDLDLVRLSLICRQRASAKGALKSTFPYTYRQEEPSVYHDNSVSQPLRPTKSNNAVLSFRDQPRQDTSMLRSRSDFAFPNSSIGVGVGSFVQARSLSQYPARGFVPSRFPGPEPVSLNKYLTEGDSPWTGFQTTKGGHTLTTGHDFQTYRSQPQSEIESFTAALSPSDSGYGSLPVATQSVKSGEYSSQSPEYSLYSDFDHFAISSQMPKLSAPAPQAEDQGSTKSTQRSRGGKQKCDKCNEILKCPSDYRCVKPDWFTTICKAEIG